MFSVLYRVPKKNPHASGPIPFKSMLFKGLLSKVRASTVSSGDPRESPTPVLFDSSCLNRAPDEESQVRSSFGEGNRE